MGLAAFALFAFQAHARWLTIEEAGLVIEKFHVDYEIQKTGAWTQTIEYAVRVQSEDAKANSSLFPIEYNATTDKVEILEAYTLTGKTRTNVDPKMIEDRDKGEARDYDVIRVRSVVFPDVQIGSKLIIRYRVRVEKPAVPGRWSTAYTVEPSEFMESFKLKFRSEIPLNFEVRDPRKWLRVTQLNPKQIEVVNRQRLPGWVHAEKDPFFHPAGLSEVFISTGSNWTEFFSSLGQEYEKALAAGVPARVKPWVEQARAKASNAEKISFLLEKLSGEFRYFGDWRRQNGGVIPRPLQEIDQTRYGDCKDLSALLTSMLRALGLDADVALVRRGDNAWGEEPDYKLPGIERFNHAVVHVRDGENTYWLDPTNPVMSLRPYPDIAGRPAWLMAKSKFARIPALKAEDFEHIHQYEYRFRGEDTVQVKLDARLNRLAGYDLANELMLAPRADVLSDTLAYFSEGQELKSHRFLKEPGGGRMLSDMHVILEYEAGRVTFTAGSGSFWVLPDGFLRGAFFETENRESDLELSSEPYIFHGIRRLKDTKLAQEAPPPCVVSSAWMNLSRVVRVDGQDVVIEQRVELNRPHIQRAELRSDAFKSLQAAAKRCFYRSGVLIEPQRLSKS